MKHIYSREDIFTILDEYVHSDKHIEQLRYHAAFKTRGKCENSFLVECIEKWLDQFKLCQNT